MRLIDADALMKNIPSEEMIAKMAVAYAPTIEPKRGEWIAYKCSSCGFDWDDVTYEPPSDCMSFCPNCGALMREREGE